MEPKTTYLTRRLPYWYVLISLAPLVVASGEFAFMLTTVPSLREFVVRQIAVFAILPIGAVAIASGSVAFVLFGRTSWTFTDQGFSSAGRSLFVRRLSVAWDEVESATLEPGTGGGGLTVMLRLRRVDWPYTLPFRASQFTADGAQTLVTELATHLPAEKLDPALLVLAHLAETREELRAQAVPELKRVVRALDEFLLASATREMERLRAATTYAPWLAWLDLARAECALLSGHDEQARDLSATLAGSDELRERALTVSGVALARLGDVAGAQRALSRAGGAAAGAATSAVLPSRPVPAAVRGLSAGWSSAALTPAIVTALVVVGLAAYDTPTLYSMTTDSHGAIYALYAGHAYRFDASGAETLVANRAAEHGPGVTNEIRVGPDGSLYIADVTRAAASAYAPNGALRAMLASGKPVLPSPVRGYDPAAAANVSVSPDASGTYLLARGTLYRFSPSGTRTVVWDDPDLEGARSVSTLPDGSLLVADTVHGRVLRMSGGRTTAVADLLSEPGGFRYPAELRVAPGGTTYAVLARHASPEPARGQMLTRTQSLTLVLGRLYRLDLAAGTAALVDVRDGRHPVNVQDVGFLPSGQLVVSAVDSAWLYRVDPGSPGAARRITGGQLGKRSQTATLLAQVTANGPALLLLCGVGLPVVIGAVGAVASGRQKRELPAA